MSEKRQSLVDLARASESFLKVQSLASKKHGVSLLIDETMACVADLDQRVTVTWDPDTFAEKINMGARHPRRILCTVRIKVGDTDFGAIRLDTSSTEEFMSDLDEKMAPYSPSKSGRVAVIVPELPEIVKIVISGKERVMILRPGDKLELHVTKPGTEASHAQPAEPLESDNSRPDQSSSSEQPAAQQTKDTAAKPGPPTGEPLGKSGIFPTGTGLDSHLSGELDDSFAEFYRGEQGSHPELRG